MNAVVVAGALPSLQPRGETPSKESITLSGNYNRNTCICPHNG
jgi:hypothetical protein